MVYGISSCIQLIISWSILNIHILCCWWEQAVGTERCDFKVHQGPEEYPNSLWGSNTPWTCHQSPCGGPATLTHTWRQFNVSNQCEVLVFGLWVGKWRSCRKPMQAWATQNKNNKKWWSHGLFIERFSKFSAALRDKQPSSGEMRHTGAAGLACT